MADAKTNPLDFECPQCKAAPGEKCKNYRGKGMAPHRERGGAVNKQHARSAEKKNEKAKEVIGPLFAEQAPQTTPEREYWHWRANIADGVERCEAAIGLGAKGLKWLKLRAIERLAAELLGAEVTAKLVAYVRGTYPMPDYGYQVWGGILTGKRIEFGFQRVENRQTGQPAVVCTDSHERAVMTKADFWARFPYEDIEPEKHEDGGAMAAFDAAMARARNQQRVR